MKTHQQNDNTSKPKSIRRNTTLQGNIAEIAHVIVQVVSKLYRCLENQVRERMIYKACDTDGAKISYNDEFRQSVHLVLFTHASFGSVIIYETNSRRASTSHTCWLTFSSSMTANCVKL